MKVVTKTVSVTVGGKINLGNYNSLQIDQSRRADIVLEEGENLTTEMVEAVTEAMKTSIRNQLRAWASEGKPKESQMAVQTAQSFAGKPVVNGDDDSLIDPKLLSDK